MKTEPFFAILVSLAFLIPYCFANEVDKQYRQELVDILENAIKINETFKKSIDLDKFGEYQENRKKVEEYYEEKILPKFIECINYISQTKDTDFSILFMKMIVSYNNSADEELSYICAKLFILDPKFITGIMNQNTEQERKYIYDRIEFGWKLVIYIDRLSESEISANNAFIEELKKWIEQKTPNKKRE